MDICRIEEPAIDPVEKSQLAACWLYQNVKAAQVNQHA
jgi:hypothetical protein